jgi:hypothetical protein
LHAHYFIYLIGNQWFYCFWHIILNRGINSQQKTFTMNAIKTLIVALVITFGAFKASAQLPTAIHIDKVKHFGMGALIAGSAQTLAYQITGNRGKSMLIGFGTGMVAGIAKECWDMTGRGCPSFKDALWTTIGAGVASVSLRYTLEVKPRHTESQL